MKIIGLLSWYDESPAWLSATVASLHGVVDHLVAVDGAYALYPEGRATSGVEQTQAILETAQAVGMGCTVHHPPSVWFGNEVEKRSFMFRVGELVAEPDVDWYMVIDGDEVVSDRPANLRDRLSTTDLDVAEVTLWQRTDVQSHAHVAHIARTMVWPRTTQCSLRMFFRAIPGLHVDTAHYVYRTPDGRYLWGNPAADTLEDALDLRDMRVDHRTGFRDLDRRNSSKSYYECRDTLKVEYSSCARCDTERATKTVHVNWELPEPDRLVSSTIAACDACAIEAKLEADAQVRALGYDPQALVYAGVTD